MEESKKERLKKIGIIVAICVGVILFLLVIASFFIVGYNKIYAGIKVNGIKLGGFTENEARTVFDNYYRYLGDIDISLYNGSDSIKFKAEDINVSFNSDQAAEIAFKAGREGTLFKKALLGLKYSLFGKDLIYDVNIDIKKFDKQINAIAKELGNEVIQPSYIREGDKLIVKTGTTGVKIDHAVIKQNVVSKLNVLQNAEVEVETIRVSPEKVDIDKIQNAIKQNVQNAEYITDTGVLVDQIIGIEIKDIEEAKKIAESVTEEGMQFAIPLRITLPETTIDSVLEGLFKDILSTYTTNYKTSEKERSENVKLAAETINNVILMPGQEFSYNNILGERTTERGYKIAKVYEEGQVVDGLGGGICQVSSTLYNAVVKADLEVIERKNHSLPVAYVKLGRDATVSYGTLDFRFRNSLQYPIRIESKVGGGTLTINICGIQTNPNRTVDIETETVAVLDYTQKIIEDANLPMGTEEIIQKGKTGYKVKSYRVTKENGVEIERKQISIDTYSPVAEIKKVSLTENVVLPAVDEILPEV